MNNATIKKNRLECIAFIIFLVNFTAFGIRIGSAGAGYLAAAFMIYEVVFIFLGSKTDETVGRILKAKYSKDKYRSARLVRKYSTYMNLFTGIAGGIFIALFGTYFTVSILGLFHIRIIVDILAVLFFLRMISENTAGIFAEEDFRRRSGFRR